jgi:hypothetical protein
MGKRHASPELTENLILLAEICQAEEQKRPPVYQWKAGHDPRRHKSKWERYATRIQKLAGQEATRSNRPEPVTPAPTTAKPIEPPKDESTDKLQEHERDLIVRGRMCQRCKAKVRTQHVKVADRQWEKLCPTCAAEVAPPALSQPARSQATQPYVLPEPVSKPRPQQCRHCQSTERPVRWFPVNGGIWLCQYCAPVRWLKWEDGKKRAG